MKDCLIIGPVTALMYNDVYPLLKDKVLLLGYLGHRERQTIWCDNYDGTLRAISAIWFTTLKVEHKDKYLPTKTYVEGAYKYYDGTDIIEVKPYNKLPKDYGGKMGVCLTFFFYYPYLDYEILELRTDLKLDGKYKFARLIIRRKQP